MSVQRVTAQHSASDSFEAQYWPYPVIKRAPTKQAWWRRLLRRPARDAIWTETEDRVAWSYGETPVDERWGISLSGGGVRSASFCLGVVQAMHRQNMIHGPKRATYLSAVSGGAYLAGALGIVTAPATAIPPGPDIRLSPADRDWPAFEAGSPEERLLRTRTRYLTHGSGGPLAALWRYLMGVLLNLVLLTVSIGILCIPIGWLYGWRIPALRRHQRLGPSPDLVHHNFSTPTAIWWAVGILAAFGLLFGLLWVFARWTGRRVNGMFGGGSAILLGSAGLLWLAVVAVPHVLDWIQVGLPRFLNTSAATKSGATTKSVGGVGIAAAVGGATSMLTGLATLLAGKAAPPVVQNAEKKVQAVAVSSIQRLGYRYRGPLLNLAATISGPLLAVSLSFLFLFVGSSEPIGTYKAPTLGLLLGTIGVLLLLIIVWKKSDLNVWSLHPFYRRRLVAAYAPQRVEVDPGQPLSTNAVGHIDVRHLSGDGQHARLATFIGPQADDLAARKADFPELLICAAANIADYGATPTGSHVTSFVFSQREVGGPLIGGMATTEYGELTQAGSDLTVPTAVAISGAAIAPSMGKMTRAPLRFLLALLNIRLGVWMVNPRRVDDLQRKRLQRRPHPIYLIREMLGWNRFDASFLYLSDGGHYENLGLVELIRRRCRWIWCIDASGDSIDTFNTIGQAVELANSELGVTVDIRPSDMAPIPEISAQRADQGKPPLVRAPYCSGRIVYPDGTEGRIVIIKAGVWDGAPWSVKSFHERNHRFPCDPTSNQLYTAERFDAYRQLGAAVMAAAWKAHEREFEAFRNPVRPSGPSGNGAVSREPAGV